MASCAAPGKPVVSLSKTLGAPNLPRLQWKALGSVFSAITIFFLLWAYLRQTGIGANGAGDAGAACTLYASPSGSDANSGDKPTAPKTFKGAAAATRPGSVVCLQAGTYILTSAFRPPTSGTPSAWIVYRNQSHVAVKFVWAGPSDASPMFKLGDGNFPSGPAYLEFRGLHLDGGGK